VALICASSGSRLWGVCPEHFAEKRKYMIVRILIVLVCVVFFINGCNSLISQFFGTHKLRAFEMEHVQREGVGDSDYIEIADAHLSGEFVHQVSEYESDPPILLYPVLSASELRRRQEGASVAPAVLAWTADFHSPCVEEGNCLEKGRQRLRGIVRDLPESNKKAAAKLQELGYEIGPEATIINHGQAPTAWYWNLSMMLVPLGLAVGMEAYFNRRES